MNKKLVKLAIIDDGINEGLYNISPIEENIEITPQLNVRKRIGYNPYLPSHGTICAAIIRKYLPNAPLTSVKILNGKSKCIKEQLVKSIEWCIDNGIGLINLSLGTVDYRDFEFIRSVVNHAYERKVIIVAAYSNDDIITYPASLSNVIGVKCDRNNQLKENEYFYNNLPWDSIEITARGSYTIKNFNGIEDNISASNSYAAPFITALVHNIMTTFPHITLEEIKDRLKLDSKNYIEKHEKWNGYLYRNIDWIKGAILFTLGKDSSMLDSDFFFFNVVDSVEVDSDSIHDGLSYIKNYVEQTHVSGNTIIVVNERGREPLNGEVEKFIEDMKKYRKNIVYIDDTDEELNLNIRCLNPEIKLWNPSIYRYLSFDDRKNINIEVPSIIIYDFEGKELLRLLSLLLNAFKGDGYYAVTAVNTCKGILMGHEPMGLQGTIEGNEGIDFPEVHALYNVYKPDIVILGINTTDRKGEPGEWAIKSIKPDIIVFITDGLQRDLEAIKKIDGSDSEVIFFTRGDCEIIGYKKGRLFNYINDNSLGEMYKYIMSLFNNAIDM